MGLTVLTLLCFECWYLRSEKLFIDQLEILIPVGYLIILMLGVYVFASGIFGSLRFKDWNMASLIHLKEYVLFAGYCVWLLVLGFAIGNYV